MNPVFNFWGIGSLLCLLNFSAFGQKDSSAGYYASFDGTKNPL